MNAPFKSLSQSLLDHSTNRPDRLAFTYLGQLIGSIDSLTFKSLSDRVDAFACHLQSLGTLPAGARAVLLYPQSLDFIVAFMACLRAGVIAVPLSLPINRQDQARLLAVVEDSAPNLVLTLGSIGRMPECAMLAQMRPDVTWIFTDEVNGQSDPAQIEKLPRHQPEDIAFLQYTSGSTGMPKGVMVTHANIMSNQEMISAAFNTNDNDVGLTWLPLYHDMGLIGCVMQSIYTGGLNHMMSPLDFLQKPLLWLEAISKYKVTITGGPNFAFELCTKRIRPEEVATLDLSSWRLAPNGAEPIRNTALTNFSEKFSAAGFGKNVHFPCYGLAEATLFVSGGLSDTPYRTMLVDAKALEENAIVPAAGGYTIVSSGKIAAELDVRVVNPDTGAVLPSGQVGEIWVAGASVAAGYWRKEQATKDTFHAAIAGSDRAYLKTGDLGFVSSEGDLLITGRLKDLIIIGGKNYYPQDLEAVAERAHASLRVGSSVAFVAKPEDNGVVLVVELRRDAMGSPNLAEIKAAVRRAIAQNVGIAILDVTVAAPGKVLKTTSGKIRRADCRKEWVAGKLADVPVATEAVPTA